MPTATELHSAEEKCSRETAPSKGNGEGKQAVITESQCIPSCDKTLSSMKDLNLNETSDYQQYHQPIHLSLSEKESEVCMEQQQDMCSVDEELKVSTEDISIKSAPIIPKLKYKYDNDQWSPLNQSGRRCYDIRLLMQIKDDPLSKTKPIGVHLELSSIVKQYQEAQPFNPMLRPINDSLFPNFAKNINIAPHMRNTTPRDHKKDNRNLNAINRGGGGRVTSSPASPAPAAPPAQPVIRVSLAREEVQLSQAKNAWKPSRLKNKGLSDEERISQELYLTFRGILNKLTPQKFDTLVGKVRELRIDTRARLAAIIDLVFDKAVDEPHFAETYAHLCHCLAALKVPSESGSPEQYVNFRLLIISKCQNQFVTDKVDDNVLRLETELADCTDTVKKKELQLLLEEENRKVRMRSVGNVRFIGELYKLKMLTAKIMVFCMNYLLDKQEEEKLECLCKLLTTIGEQVESEVKEPLDAVFKRMQAIAERRGGSGGSGGGCGGSGGSGGSLSSRVRFMLQDVIALRRRRWAPRAAAAAPAQPTTMDRIQREADLHHRNIELMNSMPLSGGYGRREEEGGGRRGGRGGGRGAAGAGGAGGAGGDGEWKSPRPYTVDVSKIKAGSLKNLSNIKLAPQHSGWNHGARSSPPAPTAPTAPPAPAAPPAPTAPAIGTRNEYSLLENSALDPASLRANSDTLSFRKGSSEKSTKADSE